jgi:hypothetical protein
MAQRFWASLPGAALLVFLQRKGSVTDGAAGNKVRCAIRLQLLGEFHYRGAMRPTFSV